MGIGGAWSEDGGQRQARQDQGGRPGAHHSDHPGSRQLAGRRGGHRRGRRGVNVVLWQYLEWRVLGDSLGLGVSLLQTIYNAHNMGAIAIGESCFRKRNMTIGVFENTAECICNFKLSISKIQRGTEPLFGEMVLN